ncbi:hypothetical protein FOA43_000568 [Brettanomyces nanus]|uniref:Non-structural maintenance of chromosomes element 4 n=1 Tax=Eeniella nana TaxID=13502 RepID=A0A875RN77_EENNA|nr:uncharacterized protein FOA43_000568 [Brettanomyces nanus]QPG73260.1 hypothetical protein FOA43_000568 [Brettanomyces nanus]
MPNKRSSSEVAVGSSKRHKTEPIVAVVDADSVMVDKAIQSGSLANNNKSNHPRSDDDGESDNESDSISADDSADDMSSDSSSDSSSESSDNTDTETDTDDSNVSDKARRKLSEREKFELTSKYRKLDEELQKQRPKVALEGGMSLVSESLNKVDQLFEHTKTSVQADIMAKDASTLREIGFQANVATKNMKLARSEKLLDFNEFAMRFNRKFGLENSGGRVVNERGELPKVNWIEVSLLMGRFSYRATTCEFLLGPLELAKKQRQTRQRLEDDSRSAATRTANAADADEMASREKSDTTAINSEKLYKKIRTLNLGKIPLFEVFIDPKSFGHSVESLFYTSFLINNGKVILLKDKETGMLYIQEANKETEEKLHRFIDRDLSKSHVIFNLDQETWKKLVDTYNIKSSLI